MTDELIRREDARAECQHLASAYESKGETEKQAVAEACDRAIAALPAVTVGVKLLVFEGRNGFWRAGDGIGGFYEVTEVYSAFHMCRVVVGVANKLIPYNSKDAAFSAANVEHQRRILAALTPTAVDASQPTNPAVNAPEMRPETVSENIARDMREGRFPKRSEPQMVPVEPAAPDPAAIREAALREAIAALDALPEYGSADVNIGVSNAYSAILALIPKGAAE